VQTSIRSSQIDVQCQEINDQRRSSRRLRERKVWLAGVFAWNAAVSAG